MDIGKILKRAWHIVWNYRALWVFGLVIAMAVGGSSGNGGDNNGIQYRQDAPSQYTESPQDFQEGFRQFTREFNREMDRLFSQGLPEADLPGEDLSTLLWALGIFVVVMFLTGIVVAIARYVSETAVIRMVDEYESTGVKKSIAEGFRLGWSPAAWRLFLIDLIVHLPLIVMVVSLFGAVISAFLMALDGRDPFSAASTMAMIVILFLGVISTALLTFVFLLFRNFFWRAGVLENLGVWESLRRGFALFRENWTNIGLMWIVMIGLGIAWRIVSIIVAILLIPLYVIMAVPAALVSIVPALIVAGIAGQYLGWYWPWILGGLFVLPLFFTIALAPFHLIQGWKEIFHSSVWTLTYREIMLPPAVPAVQEAPAVTDGS